MNKIEQLERAIDYVDRMVKNNPDEQYYSDDVFNIKEALELSLEIAREDAYNEAYVPEGVVSKIARKMFADKIKFIK